MSSGKYILYVGEYLPMGSDKIPKVCIRNLLKVDGVST